MTDEIDTVCDYTFKGEGKKEIGVIDSIEKFNELGYPNIIGSYNILREYESLRRKIRECNNKITEIDDRKNKLLKRLHSCIKYAEDYGYDFDAILYEERDNIRDNKRDEYGKLMRIRSGYNDKQC